MIAGTAVAEWDDPQVLGRNRVLTHVPLGAYADAAGALAGEGSPYVRSLNGVWRFALTESPTAMPEGFADPTVGIEAWHEMVVPSNWQLDPEVKDAPIYTNIHYPFRESPPKAPAVNPTGWYRTQFEVPAAWAGRRLFLHFESCDSACKVWVNGVEAGYSQDSKLPHEFEITELAVAGMNTLAVMVPRYCDGFWLECQDYWHLSGIQRDVTLYSKPESYLRDFTVRTTFDCDYRDAELFVAAYMNPSESFHKGGYRVRAALHDGDGALVAGFPVEAPISLTSPMYQGREAGEFTAAQLRMKVAQPHGWTAESPYLYTLVLTLIDAEGREVDFESGRVGFRQIEIRERQLLLNGRRLIVRGVNDHEHHPERGRALSAEDMREELVAMKRLNFNAVRTSHYPHHSRFYDLCDELGLYVIDEANLETHGIEALISRAPEWMNGCMERAQRMALRDRNHACVIGWSLGNESYYGPHHAGMAGWLRQFDPTRPVQYESGFPGPAVTDIMCPMYPKLEWVVETLADHGEKRPMIMCEYAYAKGNGNGNVHKFWEMVDRWPSFQGGFVWDWRDKALVREVDGQPQWAYGNEFDGGIGPDGFAYGRFENPQMCLNGVVHPDLTPKPGALELMKVQAPLGLAQADANGLMRGEIELWNKYLALSLAHLEMAWEVTENGVCIGSGVLAAPDLGPGEKGLLRIPLTLPDQPVAGGEYWLNLRARHREATAWCEAGHVIAWEQFRLPLVVPAPPPPRRPAGAVKTTLTAGTARILVGGVELVFAEGALRRYVIGGTDLLTQPLEHSFMRARTDNDYMVGHPGSYYLEWREAGLDCLETRVLDWQWASLGDGQALGRGVTRHQATGKPYGITCTTNYLVDATGALEVEVRVAADPRLPLLPRVGMKTALDGRCEQLGWYGRGPHESYVDRKHSTLVGRYASTVTEQFVPFVDPCECGGHEDTRWVELGDGAGFGLRVEGQPTLHWSALHYRIDDLIQAGHVYELTPTAEVQLNLDGFHMGLGGDTGWTRNVHPEYLYPAGTYRYGFRLQPLETTHE